MGVFIISPLPPRVEDMRCSKAPSLHGRYPLPRCRVGGGASHDAGLRPPLKLHVQFSRMQLSRKRGGTPRGQRRDQANQAHQPQLAAQTPNGEGLPPRTAPSPESMRPQASFDPTIELVEESPYVGALIVLTPSANHRIEFANQLRRRMRDATLRLPADRVLEPVDRLLGRIRVQISAPRVRLDLRSWQVECPLAALNLVAEKRESPAHMHDAGLPHVQLHAERREDLRRAPQRRFRF